MKKQFVSTILIGLMTLSCQVFAKPIIHDAEYAVIEAQNGKAWAADNTTIDEKLADIRSKNGGKPPNIIYILLDDVGFGEIGMDNLSAGMTPTVNKSQRIFCLFFQAFSSV